MPLYQFAFHDLRGQLEQDEFSCTDDSAAMCEAALTASDMLKDRAIPPGKLRSFSVEVHHDDKLIGRINIAINPVTAIDQC